MSSSLFLSFSGAVQASISVELTIIFGYATAAYGILDASSTHRLSSVCTRVFLPCLIVVSCAPQLSWEYLEDMWFFIVWSLLTISFGFVAGICGRYFFKLPGWTVMASAINTNSLPLLVLDPLAKTGALNSLAGWVPGETVQNAMERGRIYVLLYMLVQLAYAFAAGPACVALDLQRAELYDEESPRDPTHYMGVGRGRVPRVFSDDGSTTESSSLLEEADDELSGSDSLSIYSESCKSCIKPILKVGGGRRRVSCAGFLRTLWNGACRFFNPPLVAAVVAVMLGCTPFLHHLLLSPENSPLYPSVTISLKNLGDLFISLQSFTLGAQLRLTRQARSEQASHHSIDSSESEKPRHLQLKATLFPLFVRYLLMPVFASAGVYWLVSLSLPASILRPDPMLWFIMILVPQGPPAILLSAVAEMVGLEAVVEAQIGAFLFICYLASPLIAVVISLAIEVVSKLR